MTAELTPEETQRYARHFSLPGVGLEGQRRLKEKKVLLIGAGGLGSPVALYLAAAGVGSLGIVDDDRVDLSNLQRQILHGTADLGRAKTASARDRLRDVNPHVHVEPYDTRLTSANAMEILGGWDVVVDGTDNFQTRYLSNDACVLLGIPNVYGSIFRFEGQASVFATADGPCYRCLFREPPPPGAVPSCAVAGVFGVLPGLIGAVQATETIKLLLGIGDTLAGRLLLVDALRMQTRTIALRRDPQCPACGTGEIRELIDYEAFCAGAPTHADDEIPEITARELATKRERGDDFDLVDVREPHEHAYARIEGARLIPLAAIPRAASTLDPSREIVLYCHHGARSMAAAERLRELGFGRVVNLEGGIEGWSVEVDPTVRRY